MGKLKLIFIKEYFFKFLVHLILLLFPILLGVYIQYSRMERISKTLPIFSNNTPLNFYYIAIAIIFFVPHILVFVNLMQMIKATFKEMRKDQRVYYADLLKGELKKDKDIYLFEDIFIYDTAFGYFPVRFDNVKKVTVKKKGPNKNVNTVSYKLKKGFSPVLGLSCNLDEYLDLLLIIKAHNEDIYVKFKRG